MSTQNSDDKPVDIDEPAVEELSRDPEAPETDAIDQALSPDGELFLHGRSTDPEAPEVDAAEQADVVSDDDEEGY
jgi:hypothetical protein